ncbi:DNA repair protein RadC [Aeromonas hydrophila]|nr:DNA repair protein RadC [Aeromonas hydrophila]HAT1511217.1 DNA repair protein RadC [Aeromonas hydrophila]HAT1519990.1 DNA repair protein RadC [Aeromonas hydrophila]HAT1523625.1 DNA repair protein RadC [Aeromonas hydrophila]
MRYHKLKAGECPGTYVVTEPVTEQDLLRIANQIARKRLAKGTAITSTTDAAERLQTLLQGREREVFAVLFLDNQHRVIALEELFYGTLGTASVHPREVVKRALALNVAALICAHNHPSGNPEPSQADKHITQVLRDALALVEVRLLDHLVVGAEGVTSLAERGVL